jgi:hypothetical protein
VGNNWISDTAARGGWEEREMVKERMPRQLEEELDNVPVWSVDAWRGVFINSLYATVKYTHSLYATGPTCHRHQKIYLYATQWHTRDEYKI